MYGIYALMVTLVILAFLLIQYRPSNTEGFSTFAVHPTLMPACVNRSTEAQKLLARFGTVQTEDAAELRDLVSKMCCIEADIMSPGAGTYHTQPFQFRTQQDIEPPVMLVGRCLRNAVPPRDIEIVTDKFQARGRILVDRICPEGRAEFDAIVARTKKAMLTFCQGTQPSMDRPTGVRDVGFWEPQSVADLRAYQGISAAP